MTSVTGRDATIIEDKITCAIYMFTVIASCPRRVYLASICMKRQRTLGTPAYIHSIAPYLTRLNSAKFITMPPGKKAPPQQSSLTELWGRRQKKQDAPASATGSQSKLEPGTDSTANADPIMSSECAYSSHDALPRKSLIRFTASIPKRKPETAASVDSPFAACCSP